MNSRKIEPEKILLAKNIKPTPIRLKVLETLLSQTHAIRLYDIENMLDGVERTSIFRTIKNFEKNNLVHEIDDGSGATKFALCEDRCECSLEDLHVHFFCKICEQTFCLHQLQIPSMELSADFVVESANFVIKGICPNCNI
jgi:Fur family ferric uptake transcriptional regulator